MTTDTTTTPEPETPDYVAYPYALATQTERYCFFRAGEKTYQFICDADDFGKDASVMFIDGSIYAVHTRAEIIDDTMRSMRSSLDQWIEIAKRRDDEEGLGRLKASLASISIHEVQIFATPQQASGQETV